MKRDDYIQELDTWTQPENMKPLTFTQALAVHLVLSMVLVVPFVIFLAVIYCIAWQVAI